MCSGSRVRGVFAAATIVVLTLTVHVAGSDPKSTLRVCADPNNLPYSNVRGEGFENAVAEVLARDLGRTVSYYWQPQRRAFLRTTLDARACDVVMSIPTRLERVRATRPYYRSSYVFVTRRDRRLDLRTFDDPRLRDLRIGIQVTGDDYANPPAAQALASRNLVDRIRGFPVYGDYSRPSPQRTIVDAVASGDVDVAVVWGPLAGYFGPREPVPIAIHAIAHNDRRDQPLAFDMSVGVRRDDVALQRALDRALTRRSGQVRTILRRFGVPLVSSEER